MFEGKESLIHALHVIIGQAKKSQLQMELELPPHVHNGDIQSSPPF